MPVNSLHPEYLASAAAWSRARDVLAGEDAVKAAGTRYLPALDGQSPDEYDTYRLRASFYNATARTAEGYLGLLFRRDPVFNLPAAAAPALAAFLEDADLMGTSWTSFIKQVAAEVVAVGRTGTLIDWEDQGDPRAACVAYRAEQILNWRMGRVHGRHVLTLLVLSEQVTDLTNAADEFTAPPVEQLRVLRLVENRTENVSDWRYQVDLWRQTGDGTANSPRQWVIVESRVPLRLGRPLPLIPFVFHGPRHALPQVDQLPLAGVITLNLDHYRLDADYKHGLHYSALPTVFVAGVPKDLALPIGSRMAWVVDNPDAKASFLEFKGQGLGAFVVAMDHDERQMATLGTRLLEAPKRVGEAAEAIELRQAGENSVLMALALSLAESLTHVLRWVCWWHSALPDLRGETADAVRVVLNTDFSAKGLSSQEITAIVQAWDAGAISRETMFDLFRRGEVLPVGRTNEEETRLLAQSRPPINHQLSTIN